MQIYMKLSSIFFLILFTTGCSTLETQKNTVDYNQTNVIKIEQSIQGLDIVGFVEGHVSKKDIIALAPTEMDAISKFDPRDLGVRYIIEDNLIASLVPDYKVAERDQSIMHYLERETGKNYNKYSASSQSKASKRSEQNNKNEASTITNNFYGNVSDLNTASGDKNLDTKKDESETTFKITTDFLAADKLLTYRVLECGVYFKENNYNFSQGSYTTSGFIETVKRHAKTRLHCRLEDAKTGVILNAGIVENEIVDTVKKSDLPSLENIDYSFYQHKLPNLSSESGANSSKQSSSVNELSSPLDLSMANSASSSDQISPTSKKLAIPALILTLVLLGG